jgi:hypothetical protein
MDGRHGPARQGTITLKLHPKIASTLAVALPYVMDYLRFTGIVLLRLAGLWTVAVALAAATLGVWHLAYGLPSTIDPVALVYVLYLGFMVVLATVESFLPDRYLTRTRLRMPLPIRTAPPAANPAPRAARLAYVDPRSLFWKPRCEICEYQRSVRSRYR